MRIMLSLALVLSYPLVALGQGGRPLARQAPAADSTRTLPVSHAARTTATIQLDGHLDEPAWDAAEPTTSFTQVDPEEGAPASQRTEVRVLYDDTYLYVGVRLFDTGAITGRLGRRDMDLGDSDWFGVMIDSYHDRRTAFGFDVNPLGVRRDEVKIINTDDNSWDPVWDVATSIDRQGWTAEYRIPFSQLRFSGAPVQVWGIQFERVIGRRHEYATSTPMPKSEVGGVPKYGLLDGLRDLRPGKRIELLPYVVERGSYVDPGADPFKHNPDFGTSAGLDMVLRATSNLTLNAAINPDFGQVEVDPAIVNLGVYETFFEEKRPLFIEGSDVFAFGANSISGGQLFYSRRIGRAPSLQPPTAASDVPEATTILGSAKLSGQVGGWSVGLLEAVTARETARYRRPDGTDDAFEVEPMANYVVGRARREFRQGQSFVGGVVTSVQRDLSTDALQASLHRSALAGGIDFRHEWGRRSWLALGDVELSRVAGDARAITATQRRSNHFFQRPDADHLEVDSSATSLLGYAMSLAVFRQAGMHWRGQVGAALTSPTYEVNDLGFAVRTDRRDVQGAVTYLQNVPGEHLRRWALTASVRSEHNYAWQPILTTAAGQLQTTTANYWTLTAQVQRYFRAIDDRLTRGGPVATRPAWVVYQVNASSDVRKPVTLTSTLQLQDYESGGWSWSAGGRVGIKTSSRWNLSAGPVLSRLYTPAQFVTSVADPTYTATFGRRYVFAPLHQVSLGMETRFNATFSPRLSLETYLQPLLSSQDYGNARQFAAPQTYDFIPYSGTIPELDFNLRSLRGNAVLRWEWTRGSTLYVAWQQRRSDIASVGDFDFARDRSALFHTRPDNIVVVKVNYWVNPL
ncbi:MAG: carbohydrate binding family 9 domain-containing protein [Gemmatimonadaceae bacterium]|nr:carbohydrate binding family 9 domain-containing protein [Gemmatimonadaceae bacterium]